MYKYIIKKYYRWKKGLRKNRKWDERGAYRDVDWREGDKEKLRATVKHLVENVWILEHEVAQAMQSQNAASSEIGARVLRLKAYFFPIISQHSVGKLSRLVPEDQQIQIH